MSASAAPHSPAAPPAAAVSPSPAAPCASGVFIEIDYFHKKKKGEAAAGDVFLAQKNHSGCRIVATLSDGLGSGIKANVLATLTSAMISKFALMDIPFERATEIIINSLPVNSESGLAYATFTLVDARQDMTVRIFEYDNPPTLILRGAKPVTVKKERIPITRKKKNTGPENEALFVSALTAVAGDRIIFFSDGVTQSGMGGEAYPSGWGSKEVEKHIIKIITADPLISSSDLARLLVLRAEENGADEPKDDISCAVLYFRKPRNLLIMTGPPFRPESDKEFARIFAEFNGKKIISGGTSAQIVARELGTTITDDGPVYNTGIPPAAKMEGADMVCEGIITLGAVAKELASSEPLQRGSKNPVSRLIEFLLDSDIITFVVGTKINEVHQDPTMPVELEIRRNVVKRIASLLEEKYMKSTHIRYI